MIDTSAYVPDLTHGQYLLLLRHVHAEDARLEGQCGTEDDERLTALKILMHDYSEYQAENERLRAEVTRLDAEFGKANARWHDERRSAAQAAVERDQARGMLRYCYKRWPAPIFWQAAADIGSPYEALPDWLTDETDMVGHGAVDGNAA